MLIRIRILDALRKQKGGLMANIDKVQLITVAANVGRGANDGVYPPGGLLTIANAVIKELPNILICIDDQHHSPISIDPNAQVVGVQVASTLCYKNALQVAQQAKEAGKLVVLGGPHVTTLFQQVMANRNFVDFTIRGKGEVPFVKLLQAIEQESDLGAIPNLSWRNQGQVYHNSYVTLPWNYDNYTPLPLGQLSAGIKNYWRAFGETIDPTVDAAFLLFTHFGCGYRDRRVRDQLTVLSAKNEPLFCSFCSLHDPINLRSPAKILEELRAYLNWYQLKPGSNIHLKCYGDNIGPQLNLVQNIAKAIKQCSWWNDFQISWTFYCQSSYLNERLAAVLQQIGTTHLYIGFDGANDQVQRVNALGTNRHTHERAVALCLQYGMKIQGGSVVGLAGETPETLQEMHQFFVHLRGLDVLERINSAVLFIVPGTAAYEMLAQKEPQIRELDLLPTDEIRQLWIKHFCPAVNYELLKEYAEKIDALSPGPHARMGYQK